MRTRQIVEPECGFQSRSGDPVLDPGAGFAQIQQTRRFFARLQEPQEPPPKQACLGQVRLAGCGPDEENSGTIGRFGNRPIEVVVFFDARE
jgi:hypothetical protein